MKCPRCNENSELTGKKWNFSVFEVKQGMCKTCDKMFNIYYKDGKFSHTIPK
jgi:hypothetical protein